MKKIINKIKIACLDTFFPKHCLNCGVEGFFICPPCQMDFKTLNFQVCPQCEKLITENGQTCASCARQRPALSALLAATRYKENNVAGLIHLFKYNFAADLSRPLGDLLVKIILKNHLPLPDIIVPVPLHQRRLRWRGFNQAELLAIHVSENLTPGLIIPVWPDLVRRKKFTPPQMQIGKFAARRKNILGAFAINPAGFSGKAAASLNNKNVLLIDDICTTGATLFECAQILKDNGAKKIYAAVIARQEFAPRQ